MWKFIGLASLLDESLALSSSKLLRDAPAVPREGPDPPVTAEKNAADLVTDPLDPDAWNDPEMREKAAKQAVGGFIRNILGVEDHFGAPPPKSQSADPVAVTLPPGVTLPAGSEAIFPAGVSVDNTSAPINVNDPFYKAWNSPQRYGTAEDVFGGSSPWDQVMAEAQKPGSPLAQHIASQRAREQQNSQPQAAARPNPQQAVSELNKAAAAFNPYQVTFTFPTEIIEKVYGAPRIR